MFETFQATVQRIECLLKFDILIRLYFSIELGCGGLTNWQKKRKAFRAGFIGNEAKWKMRLYEAGFDCRLFQLIEASFDQ